MVTLLRFVFFGNISKQNCQSLLLEKIEVQEIELKENTRNKNLNHAKKDQFLVLVSHNSSSENKLINLSKDQESIFSCMIWYLVEGVVQRLSNIVEVGRELNGSDIYELPIFCLLKLRNVETFMKCCERTFLTDVCY